MRCAGCLRRWAAPPAGGRPPAPCKPAPDVPHAARRPSPALTRVSRGVSLLNVAELAGASGSPVKSPVKVPAGNKAFAAAVRRGAAELNAAHAEGNVLVLAFAPYAKEDSNWRKTWLTHCLGLSRCALHIRPAQQFSPPPPPHTHALFQLHPKTSAQSPPCGASQRQ